MNKKEMLLAIIRHYADGNKARFAKMLGISPQGVSTWLARGIFDTEKIYSVCEGINAAWLLTGEGDMLAHDTNTINNINVTHARVGDNNSGVVGNNNTTSSNNTTDIGDFTAALASKDTLIEMLLKQQQQLINILASHNNG